MKKLSLASISILLAACVTDPGDPAGDDQPDAPPETVRHITLNHITLNHITLNGLIANFEASRELTLVPLRSESFAPTSAYPLLRTTLLNDPWARDFVGYVASCALGDGQSIDFQDTSGNVDHWRGSLGLCTGWGAPGGSAGTDCQEIVSACILARVNKLGQFVPLSARGDGLGTGTLAPSITSVAEDQLTGAPIAASVACGPGGHYGYEDCGWRLEGVLTCKTGDRVKIGAGGSSDSACGTVGSSSNDTVLRVTEGVRARNAGPIPGGIRPYLQLQDDDTHNASCPNLQPELEFVCNNNGVYSVMTAAYDRSQPNTAHVAAVNAVIGDAEQRVYRQKEGAFYGNIFNPYALGVQVYFDTAASRWRVFSVQNQQDQVRDEQTVVRATIFKDMWACSAPSWSTPAALFHARLCALPSSGEGCAATWVGVCGTGTAAAPVCGFDDTELTTGWNHGGYEDCRDGGGALRHNVISTFLAGQCDAVPDPSVCGTVNNPGAAP
jgi:hypothetical protein